MHHVKPGTKWNTINAEGRFRANKRLYINCKRRLEDDTGVKFTITESDMKKGITTIDMKIEDECNFFSRWDRLYGHRQNINPISVLRSSEVSSVNHTDMNSTLEFQEEDHQYTSISCLVDEDEDYQVPPYSTSDFHMAATVCEIPASELVLSPHSFNIGTNRRSGYLNPLVSKIKETARTEMEPSEKSKNKSFYSAYADAKGKELSLSERKFEHDKEMQAQELEIKRIKINIEQEEFLVKIKSESRLKVITTLLEQNKSHDEIKQILESLHSFL